MGLLSKAIDAGTTKTIPINDSGWITFFSDNNVKALGIKGLSACSVFAIVSAHAVVAAHIGPNVFGSTDPISFIKLAEELTDEVVQTFLDHPSLFPPESKIYIVCATLDNNVITAPEQLRVMYRKVRSLPHASIQWYYERSAEALVNDETQRGTFFVDGRSGPPRIYVEDRDITELDGSAPIWKVAIQNGQTRYQLEISNIIIESQINPPVNQYMLNGRRWIFWNGERWIGQ